MKLFDIHVATDVISDRVSRDDLHRQLLALGYRDDELKENGLTFDAETARSFETCPLIDIHMSRKIGTREELLAAESALHQVMAAAVSPGYWHSECVPDSYDRKVPRLHQAWQALPWFCRPLHLNVATDTFKVWDLHLAMKEEDVSGEMKQCLVDHGIYFLSRWKQRDGQRSAWAVFTAQGTSAVHHGLEFFDRLIAWLQASGAPEFDAKLEITTAMKVYRQPRRVPPTVGEIEYI